MRVLSPSRVHELSTSSVVGACAAIANALKSARIDRVIAILRGGYVPGLLLSHALEVDLTCVDIVHNATDDPILQSSGEVRARTAMRERLPSASRVLLIDDIVGSGLTMDLAKRIVQDSADAESIVYTAALVVNVGAASRPDLWAWESDTWVRFPWERPLVDATPRVKSVEWSPGPARGAVFPD